MTGNDLFREIGNISEEYIVEAEDYRKKAVAGIHGIWSTKTKRDTVVKAADGTASKAAGSVILKVAGSTAFRKILATAACLVVCLGLVVTVQKRGFRGDSSQSAESAIRPNEGMMLDMESSGVAAGMTSLTENESMVAESVETGNYAIPEEQKSAQTETAKGYAEEEGMLENGENIAMGIVTGSSDGGNVSKITENYDEKDVLDTSVGKWDIKAVQKKQAEYSNDYEELLKADNAFVVVHGTIETGQVLWEEFLKHVDAGAVAQVDVISFTIEGDAIIKTIHYDGSLFHLSVDRTRDAELGTGETYYEASFPYMKRIENTQAGGDKTVEYMLTNREKDIAEEADSEKMEYSIFYIVE